MSKKFALGVSATLLLGSSLWLAGCGDGGGMAGGSGGGDRIRVGIVFDTGGLGDRSFNDSAWAGIQRAEQEFGIEVIQIESAQVSDYERNLSILAERGVDLVIAVGSNMGTPLTRVVEQFPDVNFAIVDGQVEAPNVRMLKFNEEEGSFLAGYLAGLVTETNSIAFVGGQELDLIKKFQYGFFAGALMANPNVQLRENYVGSWDNVDQAKNIANIFFRQGADIIYHAAGRAGLGVIDAARENNRLAIGVDSNQDDLEPGFVLTSMIKRVDQAVFQTIEDVVNNRFTSGEVIYDLAAGGVGLTEFEHTSERIGEENLRRVEQMRERIIAGEVTVPATQAEFESFRLTLAN